MTVTLSGLSSMATRKVLGELSRRYTAASGIEVDIQAMGGVDAAKRARAGEATDIIVLASNVMAQLEAEGHVLAGSVVGLARSGMAIAGRAGVPAPDIGDAEAVRAAVLAARSVGYSTGPSGDHLLQLGAGWGLAADDPRLLKAPPGVPVGSLVADGQAELGFQQLSELIHVEGIVVLGPLPPEIQAVTLFAAGIAATSRQAEEARRLIAYLASPQTDAVKRQEGMDPPAG